MHKKNYTYIFLLGLLVMALNAYAAPEAEFGKLSKSWILHADGSQEFRCNEELTLFTHTAMNGTYGETFIVYNPDFQELKIHSSYTRQKDGSIIKTPDNAFVEVLPRFAADAPAYNQLKEMVVVHTGLELGATIFLEYSILTKRGYYPELDIDAILQETSPVKEYTISVSVPESKPLSSQLYVNNAKVTEVVREGMKVRSWTLRNIPAASREAFQPANHDESPRLTASTYASGKDALSVIDKRFKESNSYESQTFAQYLTTDMADNAEKVKAIHNHIVNNLGYCGVPMQETGYMVRDADTVLRSAYGTLAEKTQLLAVMLNAVGIMAEVVAVYPGNLDTDVCGLNAIKGLAVKAAVSGEDKFLSAAALVPSSLTARGPLDKAFSLNGTPVQIEAAPTTVKENKAVSVTPDQVKEGFAVCVLPAANSGVDTWNMSGLNSKREGLFEIPSVIREEIVYTVTPSEGMKLQTPVKERSISNAYGKVTHTITPKNNTYEVVRTLELNKSQFSPSEYGQVRDLINEWVNPDNRVLLFSAF